MRFHPRASVLALALAGVTSANAADLPRRGPPPADYYRPVPIFTWTGPYVGLNLGGAIGSFSGGSNQLFGNNPVGIIGGLTAGYNYQAAPNIVVGIEGDINGSSLNGSSQLPFFGYSGGAQMNALFTLRGRVGYAVDRALFYVTGGLAVASVRAYVNDIRGGFPLFLNQSSWQPGYTVGGGVEYALTTNISVKGEYLYTSTGNDDYFAGTRNYSRFGIDFHTVRAGINYHF